jgi:CspA family cold shock protein
MLRLRHHLWRPSCGRSLLELTARLQFVVREDVEVIVTTGTIKKVVSDRGFGFIAADDQKEYFFHRDGLNSSLDFDRLVGGEKVSFEIEQSPKGPRAKDVTKA